MRNPNPDFLAWPLIGAAALAAMVSGHALELWLEDLRVFGESRANYAHSMQVFILEVAAMLFVGVIAAISLRFLHATLTRSKQGLQAPAAWGAASGSDFVLPALGGISRLGVLRVALGLLSIQVGSLVATELLEQHLAGFGGGLAAVMGPSHATAILVHVIVGLIFAFVVHRAARYVCAATRVILGALAVFLRRASERLRPATEALRIANLAAFGRRPPLLALGLANRPPPIANAIIA